MNEAEDEEAWIRFGNARLENLAYTDRDRTAYLASLIDHASVKLQQNGCASLLPLKIAPARFDESRLYDLHLTSDFRPAGKNGAFHFREPRVDAPFGKNLPAEARADELALAASAYLQSCHKWAKEADEVFARLTQQRLPRGFRLVEVAVCVDEAAKHTFSPEFDMLEIDFQTSRSRIDRYCKNTLPERFEDDVRLHRVYLKYLNRMKKAGADIFLDISAQCVFASTPLTPQDVLASMTGYRHIDFAVDTGHPDHDLGSFFVRHGILFANYSPNPQMSFDQGDLIIWETGHVPALALQAVKGKPLKKLIETGSLLDEATIETAENLPLDGAIGVTFASGRKAVRL
jgi:hypothetical protein